MPCQHLAQLQQQHLPVSDSEILKVICPICGSVDVCAYTPMILEETPSEGEDANPKHPQPPLSTTESTPRS